MKSVVSIETKVNIVIEKEEINFTKHRKGRYDYTYVEFGEFYREFCYDEKSQCLTITDELNEVHEVLGKEEYTHSIEQKIEFYGVEKLENDTQILYKTMEEQ